MPVTIALKFPPLCCFLRSTKLLIGVDEFTVAGGLAGDPINITAARTVDLKIPAESEVVIEGFIDKIALNLKDHLVSLTAILR